MARTRCYAFTKRSHRPAYCGSCTPAVPNLALRGDIRDLGATFWYLWGRTRVDRDPWKGISLSSWTAPIGLSMNLKWSYCWIHSCRSSLCRLH